ncbi:MAG: hypothetical protein QGE95_16645, partial [Arenicellales bacterium]|nr:hypothetical protein [Arenicellales bacterium]
DIGAYPYLNSYSGPTWYVSAANGTNTTATGASAAPFKSIQSAINFATTTGDSVTVAVGTYVENIDFRGRNIKVVGADRETTIIDGDSSGSVVRIDNSESNILIKNFTLTNGSGTPTNDEVETIRGGAIYVATNNTSDVVNLDSIIIQNSTAVVGAGFYYLTSSGKISNTIIRNNTTTLEAGAGFINGGAP